MNADPRVMEYFPATLSIEDSNLIVDRIQDHFARYGFGLWAAELLSTSEFIGFIGLNVPTFEAHFTPCIEIGWRLAAQHWGRGLATEGARAVLDHAFARLRIFEVVSFTTAGNLRSRRVMEKLGMTYDPQDDFHHPRMPADHPLAPHVLYRITSRPAMPVTTGN